MSTAQRFVLVGILLALSGACTDTQPVPLAPSGAKTRPLASVQPLCQLGCVETDPSPNSPGVWLGSGVTPFLCGTENPNGINDSDQDGLSDFCEVQLAVAFAPELFYSVQDDIRGEPHWVAQAVDGGDDAEILIGFLMSYYKDWGSKALPCSGTPFGQYFDCLGHNGDSEVIYLYVDYDFDTEHWVLKEAQYSQHGTLVSFGRTVFGTTYSYPPQVSYPSHPGAYPRSWVSEGKHANYENQSSCNSGGFLGVDTCVDNSQAARFQVSSTANLGSRSHHTSSQDCMVSNNPSYEYYAGGRVECYWTIKPFRGWVPDSIGGDQSTDYSDILWARGF
ncbi:MAG TPA: hypothetical protein VFU75_08305 [Gemmatimonadales bacterium]|nr:hypothetical protein [Gemmatimonadales bacterium]